MKNIFEKLMRKLEVGICEEAYKGLGASEEILIQSGLSKCQKCNIWVGKDNIVGDNCGCGYKI